MQHYYPPIHLLARRFYIDDNATEIPMRAIESTNLTVQEMVTHILSIAEIGGAKTYFFMDRGPMSQESKPTEKEEMRDEYDIRGGVRGKYYERYHQETNVSKMWPPFSATHNR